MGGGDPGARSPGIMNPPPDASKCVIFEGFGNGCARYSSNTALMFAGELAMAPPQPGTLLSSLTLNSKGAARRRTAVSARG
jgi:hypothetical protein